MEFPKLESNQLAVIMADSYTGIILNIKQEIHKNNSDDNMYSIFESINSAMNFIKEIAEINDKIEFVIYDNKQQVIAFIKAKGIG
jgi:hypothetical protein